MADIPVLPFKHLLSVTTMSPTSDTTQPNLSSENALQAFTAANFLPRPKLLFTPTTKAMRLRDSAAEALFYFHSNQFAKISQQHIDDVDALFLAARKKASHILRPAKVLDAIQALAADDLPVEKSRLKQLLDVCRQESFALSLVEKAVGNTLHLPSPFSDGNALCQESYEVKNGKRGTNGMVCLRFTDGNCCFFLMQFASSADGLYFPATNTLISLAHLNASHSHFLLGKLLKGFAQTLAYAASDNTFAGIIVSHYGGFGHFYYENWPAWFELAQQDGLYKKIPQVVLRKQYDYLGCDSVFEPGQQVALASDEIDKQQLEGKQWRLLVGTARHLHKNSYCYEAADHYLVAKTLATHQARTLTKLAPVQGCWPLVWLGVEGQKRCWLEQVDGYAFILANLAARYPNLGVIIDGWTLPVTPSETAQAEAPKDRQLASQILARLEKQLPHVLLMGETSQTKIAVGQSIDFFITNFATGSLHVSRLLGKPGFCHISGKLAETSLRFGIQIHPNRHVYLLPTKYVTDQPHITVSSVQTAKRWGLYLLSRLLMKKNRPGQRALNLGRLSYSIDKHQFWDFIEQRLDTVLNPPPPKLRLFMEPSFSIHYEVRQAIKMACYGNLLEVFPTLSFPKNMADLAGFSDRYLYNQVIYGVFPFGSQHVLGKPADYLVWLGDPLRRVKLHAAQFVKNAQASNQPTSLGEVLTHGHKALDNYYTRQLSGMDVPYGGCHEGMLTKAIDNLRTQFIFIGINERQSGSFDRLCQVMDWDRSLFPNQVPADFGTLVFSDAEAALAQELAHFDLRLYQAALAMTENT